MNIFSVFGKIGHFLGKALGLVKEVIPDALLKQAVDLVKQAAVNYVDNTSRRDFAVSELQKAHIPESIARLAVELAVQLVKKEVA